MTQTFTVTENHPVPESFAQRRPHNAPWTEGIRKPNGVYSEESKGLPGETLYASNAQTVGGRTPLLDAVSWAFNIHCPLVITPDSVWLTVLNGLTNHIDQDPEGLRSAFVAFEGKKELEVVADVGSMRAADQVTWEKGIDGFSDQIAANIHAGRHSLLVSNFSTSTHTDILSSKVALMGAMKHYFEYKMMFLCGFSTITVEGTQEDWTDIISRVEALSEFKLSWWTDQLLPILQEFKKANAGQADIEFWKRAYLEQRKGSGGDYDISGWINAFYPYIAGKKAGEMLQNHCINWEANKTQGLDSDDYPISLVEVPVTLDDNGTEYKSTWYGGLVGVSMAEDFTVRPESGIAIQLLKE